MPFGRSPGARREPEDDRHLHRLPGSARKQQDLIAAVSAMIDTAASEDGTLVYGLHEIEHDRPGVSVYEIYRDADAPLVHSESRARFEFRKRLPELLDSPPERYELKPLPRGKGLPF